MNPIIEEKLKSLKGKKVALAFSRGKDAIATLLTLKEYDIEGIPFYYSLCPDIKFVDESINDLENIYKFKINIIPSERYIDMLKHSVYQTLGQCEIIDKYKLTTYTKKQLNELLVKNYNIKYTAIGIKRYDSLNRIHSYHNHYGVDEKANCIYPIIDMTDNELCLLLDRHNAKLPIDYKVWGCSWDGYSARWLVRFKEYFPKDFETLKIYFPLIEVELKRWELIKDSSPDYEGYFKRKVKKFSKYCT